MEEPPTRPSQEVPKRISVLGCTGSVGASTLDLIRAHPSRFDVVSLSAQTSVEKLAKLAREFQAECAVIGDETLYPALKQALSGTGIEATAGASALVEAARRPAELAVSAIVGAAGIRASLAVLESGTTLALANKESIVCAGDLIKTASRAHGTRILPVDSEHNAIFQVLESRNRNEVEKIILTASGGPFRGKTAHDLARVTRAEALAHPNWSMGSKITVDSATLMNKGLEKIEAFHLFDIAPEAIDILVHPQSIVHGLVAYRDGSVLAQLGPPDMRVPICYCLAWPERITGRVKPLDLLAIGTLTFEAPDRETFSCLSLAEAALKIGGTAPAILNAANEVAVAAFLADAIRFVDIARVVEQTLDRMTASGHIVHTFNLEGLFAVDASARAVAQECL